MAWTDFLLQSAQPIGIQLHISRADVKRQTIRQQSWSPAPAAECNNQPEHKYNRNPNEENCSTLYISLIIGIMAVRNSRGDIRYSHSTAKNSREEQSQ